MNNQDLKIRVKKLHEEQKHTQKSNEAMQRQKDKVYKENMQVQQDKEQVNGERIVNTKQRLHENARMCKESLQIKVMFKQV